MLIYERKYDNIYPNIMLKELMEREKELMEVAGLCGVDELTVRLWLTEPEYFQALEPADERDQALILKGFMLGRQSMLRKGEVDADSVTSPSLWEHRDEFPMSVRKLAPLLNVSYVTISRISKALCFNLFQRSHDEQGCYLTLDDAEQIWDVVRQGSPYFKGESLRVEVEQEEVAQ